MEFCLAYSAVRGKPVHVAADAMERGASVTGRLLAFARLGDLKAEPIAPALALESVAEMLRPALGANIGLRVKRLKSPPPDLAAADLPFCC